MDATTARFLEPLSRSWWVLALRRIAALAFGALALIWPSLTLLWLVAPFAAGVLLVETLHAS